MSTRPQDGYIGNNARTEGEAKTWLELVRDNLAEQPGGAVEEALTIASGSITPTIGAAVVDTEASAATDDLANIVTTNHPEGRIIVIRQANSGRVITVKHNAGGAGQISLSGSADVTLSRVDAYLVLIRVSTDWKEVCRGWRDCDLIAGKTVDVASRADGLALVYDTTTDKYQHEAATGGDVVKLSTVNASTSSQITFNNTLILNATYKYFTVRMENVVFSTDNVEISAQVSVDNGSTLVNGASDYNHSGYGCNSTSGITTGADAADDSIPFIRQGTGIGNGSGEGISGVIECHGFDNADNTFARIFGQMSYSNTTGNTVSWSFSGQVTLRSGAINYLRIFPSAGTITSGRFTLYGHKA